MGQGEKPELLGEYKLGDEATVVGKSNEGEVAPSTGQTVGWSGDKKTL